MPPYIRDLGGSPSLRLPLFYAPYILVSGGLAAEAVLKADCGEGEVIHPPYGHHQQNAAVEECEKENKAKREEDTGDDDPDHKKSHQLR